MVLKKESPRRRLCECPALRCCPPVLLESYHLLFRKRGLALGSNHYPAPAPMWGSQLSPGNVGLGPLYLPPALAQQ